MGAWVVARFERRSLLESGAWVNWLRSSTITRWLALLDSAWICAGVSADLNVRRTL